jgi:hypothetical protein
MSGVSMIVLETDPKVKKLVTKKYPNSRTLLLLVVEEKGKISGNELDMLLGMGPGPGCERKQKRKINQLQVLGQQRT